MIREMERAIMKRESISTRNRGKRDARLTLAGLEKKNETIKDKAERTRC